MSEAPNFDAITFGHRVRHHRRRRGLTLDQLGELVGRPAPYLSMVENGKKEPRLSLINALAAALGVPISNLLSPDPPNRRAELEIELERAQARFASLGLPYLKPSARLSDEVLAHLTGLYRHLEAGPAPVTAGEVRRVNGLMTAEIRDRDGYLGEVEREAEKALAAAGYSGAGALSTRNILDLAAATGFQIRHVEDIPGSLRSVTDLEHRIIYIAQRNELRTRQARKAILQTLGRFLLGHGEPTDYEQFLRYRRDSAYFASAVLVPESAAVEFLQVAVERRDLAVEDLREHFYVSYQTAAQRMTNLATRHLGIRTHMVINDGEGIVVKAYENDGVPFPRDPDGGVEAQRLCRKWGARAAFGSVDRFSFHYQYTDTPRGTFFCTTYVEPSISQAVTFGVAFDNARLLRGRQSTNRAVSGCPDGPCCRPLATERWDGKVVASPRAQERIVGLLAPDPYPRVDLAEIYELVERHSPNGSEDPPEAAGGGPPADQALPRTERA
jgi:transcriptional regulator with XRE-family HTH domain/predicted transcriptional regulator